MAKKQQRKSAKAVARKREPVRTTTAKKQPQVCEVSGGKAQRLLLRLSKRYGKGPDQIASEIIADFGDTWEEVRASCCWSIWQKLAAGCVGHQGYPRVGFEGASRNWVSIYHQTSHGN